MQSVIISVLAFSYVSFSYPSTA